MRGFLAAVLVSGLLLGGCGGMSTGDTGAKEKVNLAAGVHNALPPALPPSHKTKKKKKKKNNNENKKKLKKIG